MYAERSRRPQRGFTLVEMLAALGILLFGGMVAKELHGVATLAECHALGDEPFQFDRPHLGTVLFALAAPLRLLVIVEVACDPHRRAME